MENVGIFVDHVLHDGVPKLNNKMKVIEVVMALMERLSQRLPDNCIQAIALTCLPSCSDNGSDVEPRTRW